ncbi:hypothetical protein [Antarctobacter sp.]|uniref:hypothetical protein n=1 Tax=Antarctobacter sp. TaxID=1872577 RepID=UPI003A9226D2
MIPPDLALWGAVLLAGVYHGVNPGMGWPLAVSAALMERKPTALWRALGLLAAGHFVAMAAILLPFTAMVSLVTWEREIRIGAGLLVMAMGVYLLINRRHPRMLARVPPGRLALWSFLAALAHGAGLMLVPIYLGLCDLDTMDAGHVAATELMATHAGTALAVALAHTAAMAVAGGVLALAIYHWVGLKFLTRGWFNLDVLWAVSLVLVGGIGVWTAL